MSSIVGVFCATTLDRKMERFRTQGMVEKKIFEINQIHNLFQSYDPPVLDLSRPVKSVGLRLAAH